MRPSWRTEGVQDLPDECWALVLSRLKSKEDRDAAALTCRRWRSLEALSRHSLRFLHPRTLPENQWPRLHLFLLQALHSFPNILSMTIKGGAFCDLPCSFPRVFQHKGFAQLAFLDLYVSQGHMNDRLLQCLAVGCPSLTHLSLCTSHISDAEYYEVETGSCPMVCGPCLKAISGMDKHLPFGSSGVSKKKKVSLIARGISQCGSCFQFFHS